MKSKRENRSHSRESSVRAVLRRPIFLRRKKEESPRKLIEADASVVSPPPLQIGGMEARHRVMRFLCLLISIAVKIRI
jgi:hypothetical protein